LGYVDVVNLTNNMFHRHKFLPRSRNSNLLDVPGLTVYPDTAEGMMRLCTDSYYRLLNCGLRVAAGAGSASGVKTNPTGYNRTYVRVAGAGSHEEFLKNWRAGRNFVTNGPMVFLTVNGTLGPGDSIELPPGGGRVRVEAHAVSDQPVDSLEIVMNGRVVAQARTDRVKWEAEVREGAWLAARATSNDHLLSDVELERYRDTVSSPTATGGEAPSRLRFGHTSPVYVGVGGKGARVAASVEEAGRMLTALRKFAEANAGPEFRPEILEHIEQARARLGAEYDLVLRNGLIVDGTGNAPFHGDVAIRGGRIAAMGRLGAVRARRVVDATNRVIAPGFIDIHNHSDESIFQDGDAESMVRQGVTSMIFGEGSSAAPSVQWKDFAAYFSALLRRGIATNIGSFWTWVRGPKAGPPTAAELDAMREQVRVAMRQGALGVASSLSGPPGAWIDTATLVALCEVAGLAGGRYSTHLRTEGKGVFEAVAEALEIGRKAHVPVDIIHLTAARAAGQDVEANVYPYGAGQNDLSAIIPPWAQEGGGQSMIRRLNDRSLRARLEREIEHGIPGSNWYNHYTATGGWEGMLLVSFSNSRYKRFEGKRMSEVIATLGGRPLDVLFELLRENGGSVPTVYFHHSEEDMRYALRQPFVSIGSDGTAVKTEGPLAAGHPHPRYYGTFPRVLGRYVREEKVLTLAEAIRKRTSANAAKIGVWDRGLLRPGLWADVTVFDAATIIDRATYEQPHQYAVGIDCSMDLAGLNGRASGR
ncbi:MAG: CehA/McbA family metallohydrolase, partial [Acidobacteria bacterium]|nr:CehA/McbA family metallohydrolase [Acidobacteriota bacterium]